MTNTAGHSDRRAHCSLCPDGPWNKSAQAETDFQYKDVGATACLLFSSRVTQPGPEEQTFHICTVGVGMGGPVYVCERENVSFYSLLKKSVGEGNSTPFQYSCLETSMDGGAWWAAVHRVAKSWIQLSDFTLTFHFHVLEKEMATHSSALAWRIPGTGSLVGCRLWDCTELDMTEATSTLAWEIPWAEEPGRLQSMGSGRVGHD